MHVVNRAEVFIPRTPETVFDLAMADATLPKILRPAFPIPGVVRIELDGGTEPSTGVKRRAFMTDRSVMVEEIVTHVRPTVHAYRWATKPPLPLRPIVRGASARFAFEPSGSGTRVVWRYTFELTSPLIYVHGRVIAYLFQRWMQKALTRFASLATG
jgi:hypothetical protein